MCTGTRPSAVETYKLMDVERNVDFVMWRDRGGSSQNRLSAIVVPTTSSMFCEKLCMVCTEVPETGEHSQTPRQPRLHTVHHSKLFVF